MKLTHTLCGMLSAAGVWAAPAAALPTPFALPAQALSADTTTVVTIENLDTLRVEKRIVIRMRDGEGDTLVVQVDSTLGKGIQIEMDLKELEGMEDMLEELEMGLDAAFTKIETDVDGETAWEFKIPLGNDAPSGDDGEGIRGLWKGFSFGTGLFYTSPNAIAPGLPEVSEWGTPAAWSLADDRIGSNWRMELNPIEYRAKLIGERFGLTTGFGMDLWRVGVEDGVKLTFADAAATTGLEAVAVDSLNMRRHALRAGWVRVPLLLDLHTSKTSGEGFHLAAGIVGGVKLYSSYRRVYEDAVGGDWKEKYKGFGVNRFAASGRIQAGFKHVSLVVEVPMLPFFEGELENNVGAVTVGLHFGSHE